MSLICSFSPFCHFSPILHSDSNARRSNVFLSLLPLFRPFILYSNDMKARFLTFSGILYSQEPRGDASPKRGGFDPNAPSFDPMSFRASQKTTPLASVAPPQQRSPQQEYQGGRDNHAHSTPHGFPTQAYHAPSNPRAGYGAPHSHTASSSQRPPSRRPCKFGSECRKLQYSDHIADFSHPGDFDFADQRHLARGPSEPHGPHSTPNAADTPWWSNFQSKLQAQRSGHAPAPMPPNPQQHSRSPMPQQAPQASSRSQTRQSDVDIYGRPISAEKIAQRAAASQHGVERYSDSYPRPSTPQICVRLFY
jgi:hypothetical protein